MPVIFCNHALKNSGGIERYLQTLVSGLHQRGDKPVVIAKKFDRSLPEYRWVKPVQLNVSWVPRRLRDFAFDWLLRRIKRKGLGGELIALNQTGAADIAICGSTHPGYLQAMGQCPTWLDRRKIDLERKHFTNARLIIAHSAFMKQQVMQFYGLPADKIRVMYPPVDTARFGPVSQDERARLRAQLGLPPDQMVFLLASTGHKRKGLPLLEALFSQTQLPICLAVAGRPIQVKSDRVRYLGYRHDMENVYRAVDCTIMASSFEPFGLVGVESVLSGTPVLLARGVGCAEVIGEPAARGFDLDDDASLQSEVHEAWQAWHDGRGRVLEPLKSLSYNPSVQSHLDALLGCLQPV